MPLTDFIYLVYWSLEKKNFTNSVIAAFLSASPLALVEMDQPCRVFRPLTITLPLRSGTGYQP
ncbi:hypothetical protein D3C81_1980610 [compost metagenome]